MGSGSSPLANRLVEVGAERIAARNRRAWTHSDDVQYRLESRDVVAVVLRELASAGALLEHHGSDMGEVCRVLADEIEKGE